MLITICRTNDGEDLLSMTVYMPSIEVGTVGGGAVLDLLGSVLEMLGIKGARYASPGQDAQRLACIILSWRVTVSYHFSVLLLLR